MQQYPIYILWLFSLIPTLGISQQYFKIIEAPDNYFNQKIDRFPNGDILIVDSSLEALRVGSGGKLFATRIDRCGNTVWSNTYERANYLEFKDVAISESGEVFIYGSEYANLQESIFIMKLGKDGEVLRANLFQPETVDHFAHTIHIKGGQVLIYGFGLDFNTLRRGYVVLLDENLNYQWGKTFEPFAAIGDAILVDDGIIMRSGQAHIKLNASGDIIWASELDATNGARTIQGPIAVNGGYIFEARQNDQSFLYKLNESGRLLWQTESFTATGASGSISSMKNQDIAFTYLYPEAEQTYPCFALFSPNGDLVAHQQFNTEIPLLSKTVYQSIYEDETLAVAGNADPLSKDGVDAVNFLLQFSMDTPLDECFAIRDYSIYEPNDLTLNFLPLDLAVATTVMEQSKIERITIEQANDFVSDYCGGGTTVLPIDTLLDCDSDWDVILPEGFVWEDQTTATPRVIEFSGTYRARNVVNCAETIIHEYTLEKPSCDCNVYLPSAFSPNLDNINDELTLFTDCTLSQVEVEIYDRWGQQIFARRGIEVSWDGTSQGKLVPEGIYVANITYKWLDSAGAFQERSVTQDVSIVR